MHQVGTVAQIRGKKKKKCLKEGGEKERKRRNIMESRGCGGEGETDRKIHVHLIQLLMWTTLVGILLS